MRLNADQKLWIETLKTTDKKQCRGRLHDDTGWCCLGVAADLFVDPDDRQPAISAGNAEMFENNISCAPETVVNRLNLRCNIGAFREKSGGFHSLVDMNDNGKTFKEIAAFIEAHPEQVFIRA